MGKTELTKALARFLFGSEEALIQLDMSEFMERHTVSRLVGAPPGYVGYEEAGQLTEAIRRRPYSIVVFDEIEKAHPEAHNMLLQIMEEGHLSDARGHKVDFRNAIIVMTSNIGADMIKRQTSLGFTLKKDEALEEQEVYDEMRKKLLDSLKRVFRPEFINRLDAVIVFRALTARISRRSSRWNSLRYRIACTTMNWCCTPPLKRINELAARGYDPDMGARPLRRVIQQTIEDPLSDKILSGEIVDGDVILIDLNEEKQIVLRSEEKEPTQPQVA